MKDDETIVSSRISFYKNPKVSKSTKELFLNGDSLELLSIKIDEKEGDYELKDDGLLIINPPENFILETVVRIHPESNTSLNGLYQSSGNFCTQCEAHGFRQITYYLDRPDILSIFTTHINANKDKYPILLSNGNLVEESNSHAVWHDPAPKPCYLFALVAGKLDYLQDNYTTATGRKVDLRLYVEPHNMHKTDFAMASLKKAFAWEEERFNLSYDLDIYMIVAVDDFNMGAMENKGLNIFNSDCVLANQETTVDEGFIRIESIIGHEYFHNWTGNRVTCRDWFQLSLKEGLTVFRDQEFSSDIRSRAIQRIKDVVALKTYQFSEDSGPMAHPVRPESYISMDNFYTATVYEKGAEVIRMIHTILGEEGFQKGMQLYFHRHDGDAVTIDDFVASMADANDFNFEPFMSWYSKSGTPEVEVIDEYDADSKIYRATFTQKNQQQPFIMPNTFGLLDDKGSEVASGVVLIDELEKTVEFNDIKSKPTPSWFRGLSAPIKFNSNLSVSDKLYLCANDTDPYNRWDNAQGLWLDYILTPEKIDQKDLFDMLKKLLQEESDLALLSEMMTLPSERIIHQRVGKINVTEVNQKRENVNFCVIRYLEELLLSKYDELNHNKTFDLSTQSIGERALKNTCLSYLVKSGEYELAYKQFNHSKCMSDQLSSFQALVENHNPYQKEVIERFYQLHSEDIQVMDRWFSVQSISPSISVAGIRELMSHKLFTMTNPNRIRSVFGAFTQNHIQFHCQKGYQLMTEVIIELDALNPQIAARFASVFNHWRRFTSHYSKLQEAELKTISKVDNLSNNVYEIVHIALDSKT